jgi:hypothetical protein
VRVPAFAYALQPLLQQATWQLDAAQAELAAGLRQLEAAQADAKAHEEHVAALLDWMRPATPLSLDPVIARNRVAYLAQAAEKTASLQRELQAAEEAFAALQARCRACQLKLDGIRRHREERERDHRRELDRQAAVQSDDRWLVRQHWVAAQSGTDTSKEQTP